MRKKKQKLQLPAKVTPNRRRGARGPWRELVLLAALVALGVALRLARPARGAVGASGGSGSSCITHSDCLGRLLCVKERCQ